MAVTAPEFERGVVRPLECLGDGWRLVADRYWLFLGITAVGVILGSLAPLGILMGPCMCGIYYCLLRQASRQPVTFDMLFKGFNYFVESLIATLLMLIPMLVLIVPVYLVFFVSLFRMMPVQPQAGPPDPGAIWGFLGTMGLLYLAIFIIAVVVSIFFTFSYPLIVDYGLGGVDAVRASVRAALGNFGGLAGLILLNALLGLAGVLCCYVGALLVMPVTFGAIASAYQRVFPAAAVTEGSEGGRG
jgi:hypothetical protein